MSASSARVGCELESPGNPLEDVAEAVFAHPDLGIVNDRERDAGINPAAAEAIFSELSQSGV